MKPISLILGIMLLLAASCTMPATTVKTVDTRPAISITGAPQDAVLFVDGVDMGNAAQYDGHPKVLIIESGTHRIEVRQGGAVLHQQNIFVESELKNIVVK